MIIFDRIISWLLIVLFCLVLIAAFTMIAWVLIEDGKHRKDAQKDAKKAETENETEWEEI